MASNDDHCQVDEISGQNLYGPTMNQPTPLPRGHVLRDCTYIGTEMISRRRAEEKPIKVMSDLDASGKVIKARFRPDPTRGWGKRHPGWRVRIQSKTRMDGSWFSPIRTAGSTRCHSDLCIVNRQEETGARRPNPVQDPHAALR